MRHSYDEYVKRDCARARARRVSIDGRVCERCGHDGSVHRLERHHHDYGNPLKFEVLCKSCHINHHRQHGHIPDGSVRPVECPKVPDGQLDGGKKPPVKLTDAQHAQLKGYAAMRNPDGSSVYTDGELARIFKCSNWTVWKYKKIKVGGSKARPVGRKR